MIQHDGLLYARSSTGATWHLARLAETGNGALLLHCQTHVLHTSRATTRLATEEAPGPVCVACLHFTSACGPDCRVCRKRATYNRERRL